MVRSATPDPQPDIGHPGASAQSVDHPVEGGKHHRDEGQPGPGSQHPLNGVGGRRAEVVIAEADPGPERIGQPLDHLGRCDASLEGAGGEPQALDIFDQNVRGFGPQLELVPVRRLDERRGGLTP